MVTLDALSAPRAGRKCTACCFTSTIGFVETAGPRRCENEPATWLRKEHKMPSLPGRGCSTPGCRNAATKGSLCDACKRPYRGSTDERGYDPQHKRLRILAFQRDQWRCVDCGWRPQVVADCEEHGLDEPNTEVILEDLRRAYHRGDRHLQADHIIPVDVRPDLAHDLDNYATRCNQCHNAKSKRGDANAGSAEPSAGPRVR